MSRIRIFSRAQRCSSPISYPLRSCVYLRCDKGIAAASTCCLQESHVTLVCHVKPPLFFSLIANPGQTQCILFILVPSKLSLSLVRVSFSNDVGTALRSHPHLVDTTSLDIDTIAHSVCLLLGTFLLWISHCELSFADQMRRQASVGVWTVVGVPVANNQPFVSALGLCSQADLRAIGPGEHV